MAFPFRYVRLMLTLVLVFVLLPVVRAQEGTLDKSEPKGITVEEVIKRFSAKEKEFKEARDQYTYRQDVKVQTLEGDTPDGGEYKQVFDVSFDDKGRRVRNVVFAPQSTGKKRYFQGRLWVDDHDFQIVKTYGKTVPDIKKKKNQENLFPKFTTWREQIDGKYWFPTYTRAEDTLKFAIGDVKIREIVKYSNYKRFGSKVTITYQGQEVKKVPDQQPDKPQEKPQ